MSTFWPLIAISLLIMPSASDEVEPDADAVEIIVYGGRPLMDAAEVLAETFGQLVTCEEAPYSHDHPMEAVFPGSPGIVPEAVDLAIRFSRSRGLQEAADTVVTAAAQVLPERYVTRETAQGGVNIVPAGGEAASDVPLDAKIKLPRTRVSTAEVLDLLVAQISQVFPDVEIQIAIAPERLAHAMEMPRMGSSPSAREILNRVARLWSGSLMSRDFFTWHLRFSPGESETRRKLFFLVFFKIRVADPASPNLFVVESRHPMPDVLRLIENRFKVPILVEEPPVVCRCGLLGHSGTPSVALAGGLVKMRWSKQDTLEDILLRLLNAERVGDNNSGIELFELDWSDYRPVLRPSRARNEESEIVHYQPLLHTDLTDQLESAPNLLTLEQVVSIVSAKTARKVAVGLEVGEDMNALTISKQVGADVTLEKLLTEGTGPAHTDVSFHLLYDPVLQGHRLVVRRIGNKSTSDPALAAE